MAEVLGTTSNMEIANILDMPLRVVQQVRQNWAQVGTVTGGSGAPQGQPQAMNHKSVRVHHFSSFTSDGGKSSLAL